MLKAQSQQQPRIKVQYMSNKNLILDPSLNTDVWDFPVQNSRMPQTATAGSAENAQLHGWQVPEWGQLRQKAEQDVDKKMAKKPSRVWKVENNSDL